MYYPINDQDNPKKIIYGNFSHLFEGCSSLKELLIIHYGI
jgi:hypothetical protein